MHELEGEWAWHIRLTKGTFPDEGLDPTDYPTVDSIHAGWGGVETEIRTWAASLRDEDFHVPPPGETNTFPLSVYVMHFLTHGMQQFSDAAVLLSSSGASPGEIDFLNFAGMVD